MEQASSVVAIKRFFRWARSTGARPKVSTIAINFHQKGTA
jgi:hypothetical protein